MRPPFEPQDTPDTRGARTGRAPSARMCPPVPGSMQGCMNPP